MIRPCKNCIVQVCCTSKCDDYIEYVMEGNLINITALGDDRRKYLNIDDGEQFYDPIKMKELI